MNHLRLIFVGVFLTFASAWLGIVAYSYNNLGHYLPVVSEDTGDIAPPPMSGLAQQGQRVYAANGCVYCHSQQVRQVDVTTSDILRGWGKRPLVARDYMHESPAFLGIMRVGPDLANIGERQTNAQWYHRYLYEATTVTPNSIMPSYRYLYKLQEIQSNKPAEDALTLSGPHAPKAGWEVVPSADAKALVAYLMSLNHNYALPEAKEPKLE
ncbi:MAG: cbb3-type cytochrome c oxidase subunit II [Chthoniobacterales bacterium]